MEKGRILVTISAVMLALQLVFCFFSTIVRTDTDDGRVIVLDSFSTLETIEYNTDLIEDIADDYAPSDKMRQMGNVCYTSNFWVCLFLLVGVAALVCGISLNESNTVAYIIILIGSICMALIPFIIQWSHGEIINFKDIDNRISMNFSGWLQALFCVPIWFVRLGTLDD